MYKCSKEQKALVGFDDPTQPAGLLVPPGWSLQSVVSVAGVTIITHSLTSHSLCVHSSDCRACSTRTRRPSRAGPSSQQRPEEQLRTHAHAHAHALIRWRSEWLLHVPPLAHFLHHSPTHCTMYITSGAPLWLVALQSLPHVAATQRCLCTVLCFCCMTGLARARARSTRTAKLSAVCRLQ